MHTFELPFMIGVNTMSKIRGLFFLLFSFIVTPVLATPILQINGAGQLTGAWNVEVEGTLLDVKFMDGTCIELFNGCDSSTDFYFTTSSAATAASQALLDTVFLDGIDGQFDSSPDLTLGCEDPDLCRIYTPFTIASFSPHIFEYVSVGNNLQNNNIVPPLNALNSNDYTLSPSIVFAVWSASSVEISEPPLLLMLVIVLAVIGGLKRTQHRSDHIH
ncbi:hypothetical protein [Photobacterium sp. TLY01]|uniref:hypothetical protein n=1 Tax=Photobacterium sp. TLY01 TaxID=2907534 RepID=UPI001F2BC1AE|nr:hypothetical protein [Photobacterium sp. TLY01]UIP28854.1 hypothetical protein LN341_05080 [Photobacterium sp. TLY01]